MVNAEAAFTALTHSFDAKLKTLKIDWQSSENFKTIIEKKANLVVSAKSTSSIFKYKGEAYIREILASFSLSNPNFFPFQENTSSNIPKSIPPKF